MILRQIDFYLDILLSDVVDKIKGVMRDVKFDDFIYDNLFGDMLRMYDFIKVRY